MKECCTNNVFNSKVVKSLIPHSCDLLENMSSLLLKVNAPNFNENENRVKYGDTERLLHLPQATGFAGTG